MNLNLNAGALPATSVSGAAGWGDPLLAGRYHRELGNGFGLTAYGDVGGFGLGAHVDWQVIGTIDYALNSSSNLRWVIAASISNIRRATVIWASMFT
jgi:hypothetical protein